MDPNKVEQQPGSGAGNSRDDIVKFIREAVGEHITHAVNESVADMRKQHTEWMEQIRSAQRSWQANDPEKTKGFGAGRFVRALAFGRGDVNRAVYFAQKSWDDPLGESVVRALQAGNLTAGGVLVPEEFAAEVIELLRARSVVRAAGPRTLPMNNGTLTIRKQTATASTQYVGEGFEIPSSQPETGQITLTSKKLAALVPISNDLLTFSAGPTADEFVRDDLVMSIATREDQAFLRDDGTQEKPRGLRHWALPANILATAGTSAANVETDFKDLVNQLETQNVRMIRPVWFMSPRSKNHLMVLREAAGGNLVFPGMGNQPLSIYGWPVFVSTNIPSNLGGGTETEVYLVDMADAIIGESTTLEIAVDASASYLDSTGQLVSAFARDETVMRAIELHDFAVRHQESVAVKRNVTWGA